MSVSEREWLVVVDVRVAQSFELFAVPVYLFLLYVHDQVSFLILLLSDRLISGFFGGFWEGWRPRRRHLRLSGRECG